MNPLAMFAVGAGLATISAALGWLRNRSAPTVEPEKSEPELETYIPEHLVKRMEEIHWEYMRTRMPPQLMKRSKPLVGYSDRKTKAVHPGIEDWQWDTKWGKND